MTNLAWVVLVLTALAAVVDWVAVAGVHPRLEYVAKPLTTLGLIGLALSIEPVSNETIPPKPVCCLFASSCCGCAPPR